jgi:hypothetical protein
LNPLDQDLAKLRALGLEAAPAAAPSAHVTDPQLARMRADDESVDLDPAYRHVSSCAACRARLLERVLPERVATALALANDGEGTPAVAPPGLDATSAPAPARVIALVLPRRWLIALGVAAALALAVGAGILRPRDEERLAIAQRSYLGMMGRADAGAATVAPEDADVELSFGAPSDGVGAALVAVDEAGNILAPVRWFTRGEGGRLVAVVAPRAFTAHAGVAFGLVVVGDVARVREGTRALGSGSPGSLDAVERAIRASGGGVRVQRVVIGQPSAR